MKEKKKYLPPKQSTSVMYIGSNSKFTKRKYLPLIRFTKGNKITYYLLQLSGTYIYSWYNNGSIRSDNDKFNMVSNVWALQEAKLKDVLYIMFQTMNTLSWKNRKYLLSQMVETNDWMFSLGQ
jgi:hypothetical protein